MKPRRWLGVMAGCLGLLGLAGPSAQALVEVGFAPPAGNGHWVSTNGTWHLSGWMYGYQAGSNATLETVTNITLQANGVKFADASLANPTGYGFWSNDWTAVTYGPVTLRAIAYTSSGSINTATISGVFVTTNSIPLIATQATNVVAGALAHIQPVVTDPDDGQPLRFEIVTPPAHGTVVLNENHFRYTAPSGLTGADPFTIRVHDGFTNSADTQIDVTVSPNTAPNAFDLTRKVAPGQTNWISTVFADPDAGQSWTTIVVSAATHGAAWSAGTDLYYAPAAGVSGVLDSFSYLVSDGVGSSTVQTVSLQVPDPAQIDDVPAHDTQARGRQRCLVICVDWPDQPATNAFDLAAKQADAQALNDWVRAQSLNQTEVEFTIVPQWVRMPYPRSSYGTTNEVNLQTDDALAAAAQIDPRYRELEFDRVWLSGAKLGSLAGWSYIGRKRMWGTFDASTAARHELAHSYGLSHEDQSLFVRPLELGEEISLHSRVRLGWIGPADPHGRQYATAATSGVYRVMAYTLTNSLPSTVRALRMAETNGIEHTPLLLTGYNPQERGAILYSYSLSDTSTNRWPRQVDLVPATAGTNGWADGNLTVGKSWYDPSLKVTLECLAEQNVGTGYVDLRVTYDGQPIPSYHAFALLDPTNITAVALGLDYEYFEGSWDALPEFQSLLPLTNGVAEQVGIEPRQREDGIGFVFTGFLEVPADDVYTFALTANDGARVTIGGTVVVSVDGLRDQAAVGLSPIGLRAGKHALRVEYFQKDSGRELALAWARPGVPQAVIPAERYWRSTNLVPAAGPDQSVTDTDRNGSEWVALNGSASTNFTGAIAGYEWRADGTLIGTGVAAAVLLPVGTHTITLTVIASDGQSASDAVLVRVWPGGLDPALVLQLKLNETNGTVAADSSLTQNHGSLRNGPVWTTGKFLNGLQLDGVNDHLELTHKAVDTAMGHFTVALWFKTTSANYGTLYWEAPVGGRGVWLRIEPAESRIRGFVGQAGDNCIVATTNAFNDGQWHHLAFTMGATNTARLYIDGSLQGQTTQAITVTNGTGAVGVIGRRGEPGYATPDHHFTGGLDDVRIYHRALTPGEIAELLSVNEPPIARAGPDQQLANTGNDCAEWVLLDGSGSSDPEGAISSYVWKLGGAQVGTGAVLNLALAAGTHDFLLEVADPQGAIGADTVQIIVTDTALRRWKCAQFGTTDPVLAGDQGDNDGDGLVNLLEYAFGLDPLQADAAGGPTVDQQDGYLTLRYRRSKTATDLTYVVEGRHALEAGDWEPVLSAPSFTDLGDDWLVEVPDTVPINSVPSRFLRLRVSGP